MYVIRKVQNLYVVEEGMIINEMESAGTSDI
jgi:hypothetical protein